MEVPKHTLEFNDITYDVVLKAGKEAGQTKRVSLLAAAAAACHHTAAGAVDCQLHQLPAVASALIAHYCICSSDTEPAAAAACACAVSRRVCTTASWRCQHQGYHQPWCTTLCCALQ